MMKKRNSLQIDLITMHKIVDCYASKQSWVATIEATLRVFSKQNKAGLDKPRV